MSVKIINICTDDGHRFDISCYGDKSADQVLLFFPAMGVEARYYRDWAISMAQRGFLCCISDLRGHGSSNIRPRRGTDFGYHSMIEQDYQTAINGVLNYAEADKIYLGGHSLGGQLSCLYAATRNLDQKWLSGLVLIAACTIHHKGWAGSRGIAMRIIPYFFSATVTALGYFPGNKLNFAGVEARQQLLDWAQSGIQGMYKPQGYENVLEPLMQKVQVPLLAISFEGDSYAPEAAVDHLVSKMSGCKVNRQHLTIQNYPKEILHHFQWARKQPELTADLVAGKF